MDTLLQPGKIIREIMHHTFDDAGGIIAIEPEIPTRRYI
jgi:hypothetical protein